MNTPRAVLIVGALMVFSASVGALGAVATTDANSAEPVEECIFGFLGVEPDMRENINAAEIEAACELPAGDIERITTALVEASESP